MSLQKKLLVFACLLCSCLAHTQKIDLNKNWQFIKSDVNASRSKWKTVHIPHTWNVADVTDDSPGYYRGVGWYKKQLFIGKELSNKELILHFEGANQETEVYINGKKAGEHIGGYTGFKIPITKYVNANSANEILVKVDNKHNVNIPPLTADFTFYGGIYRDVFLEISDKVHFSNAFGADGVFITTPSVSKENAIINLKAFVQNESVNDASVFVTTVIKNKAGVKIAELKSAVNSKSGMQDSIVQIIPNISNPVLWSPENPYLYSAETKITNNKGEVLDVVKNKIGFRWFTFDAEKGFFLNGSPYKFIGASRHQDRKGKGNAVSNEEAINDVILLKKMGGNFLRVAHYPQDPIVMQACDSLGLLASVEIPIVNEITESDSFYTNCENMQLEMIKQNFNHPSVIMWCYMNEVLLRPHYNNDKEKQKTYFENIAALARRLENLTRNTDPSRYTMMANHGSFNQYKNVGLIEIPMIVGWNLYSGWYGGKIQDFPVFLDDFHKAYPKKFLMVTEYGSDADPRIRSTKPIRFDKSVEYTTMFHQYYLTEMLKRPFVAGAAVWNLGDFNSETRNETMPHINNKGLLEWDRTAKDPYYYYQAMLLKTPFIKILGEKNRYGMQDSSSINSLQLIQIASNLDSVTIKLNEQIKTVKIINGLGEIQMPFTAGVNSITATGMKSARIYADKMNVHLQMQPHLLTDKRFSTINILLGADRYFKDEKGNWWQPDQPYQKGQYGFVGGKRFKIESNTRLPYGTDKNILNTNDDPIYQTQHVGIQQYKFDVSPGNYELSLHFAELLGGEISSLPYNLSDEKQRTEKINRRVFNVSVNGRRIAENLNLAQQYGYATPVVKTMALSVKQNESIVISFEAIEGEPVLNAVQLKRK
jgi:beta-galactosidase